jgi:hypothetical protein
LVATAVAGQTKTILANAENQRDKEFSMVMKRKWRVWICIVTFLLQLPYLYNLGLILRTRWVDPLLTEKNHTLFIGGKPSGVSVYCNDTWLGQIPFRISHEEFTKKVQPVSTPPRQERMRFYQSGRIVDETATETPVTNPRDIAFTRSPILEKDIWNPPFIRNRDPGTMDANREVSDQKLSDSLRNTSYWWSFKIGDEWGMQKGGFSGEIGTTNLYSFTHIDIQVEFPAASLHEAALEYALLSSNYEPSPEWIAHLQNYEPLFFAKLYHKSETNTKLRNALQTYVKAKYALPTPLDQTAMERLIDDVLNHISQSLYFMISSPESVALDLCDERVIEKVEKEYLSLISSRYPTGGFSWHSGHSAEGGSLYYGWSDYVQLKALEQIVKKYKPRHVLSKLLYIYSQSDRGEPAIDDMLKIYFPDQFPKIEHARDQYWVQQGSRQAAIRRRSEEMFPGRFPGQNFAPWMHETYFDVPDAQLEERIAELVHSKENQSIKFTHLLKVQSPLINDALLQLGVLDDQDVQRGFLVYLSHKPNPYVEPTLLKIIEASREQQRPLLPRLLHAVVSIQTPSLHATLLEIWQHDPDCRSTIANALRYQTLHETVQDTMHVLFKEERNDSVRQSLLPYVKRLAYPTAHTIVSAWMANTDEQNHPVYQDALNEMENYRQTVQDLIEGKIKPSDLLPPSPAYVWDGEKYVRESNGGDSDE